MSEVIAPSHYYDFCGLAILQPLIEGCFLARGTNLLKLASLTYVAAPNGGAILLQSQRVPQFNKVNFGALIFSIVGNRVIGIF